MHIAFVTTDIRGQSGWGRYGATLGKALVSLGHQLTVLCADQSEQSWCEEMVVLRPPLSYMNNPLRCISGAYALRSALAAIKPDIVHVIAEPYALPLALLPPRIPLCMTIHGTYAVLPLIATRWTRWLARRALKRMDGIFSVSTFTKHAVAVTDPELWHTAQLARKILVLPNAVPVPAAHALDHRPTPPYHLISVGAVKERKGCTQLIRACARFGDEMHLPWTLDIYGSLEDPHYVATLQRQIRESSLEDSVRLHGTVSDAELEGAYLKADAFILLSLHIPPYVEGYGLVFLEANAHGLPVIGPRTGGCPEAIRDGITGYVCDPMDVGTVARRLHDVLLTGTIDRRACRQWAMNHSIESAAARLLSAYQNLCATFRTFRTR